MNTLIFEKAQELMSLLKQKNLKISTAESCTGGMVASYITSVSGASEVFELGITSYSNRIKNEFLKVGEKTLETHGAVSYDTAKEMAQNVRLLSNSDIGISVTGVAGPSSQEGHKPGTVFIGYCDKFRTDAKQLDIEPQNREFVREQAVLEILESVIKNIK